ncbi:MAG: hypothetical protein WA879_01795 [Candidatus Acidiferrales bacterium]
MSIRPASIYATLTVLLFLFAFAPSARAQAGPPFQTDDPTPVPYGNYEAYIFGSLARTPVETDPLGPAFEFNWGAIPNIQLHAILPLAGIMPSNNSLYFPAGVGPSAYGLTDMELGVKYGFLKQTARRPQIGIFPMFEIPTGNYSNGLGVGRVWYKLPLWVEKEFGPWSLVGGAGYAVVPQIQYNNYAYGGFLVKRVINKRLELSAEIFSHGAEGLATPQIRSSTLIDAGGYYHFKRDGLQLLFAYGHSVAGFSETYAYLGLYATWGKHKDSGAESAADAMALSQSQ